MKTKTFSKKLMLKRDTIAHLNTDEMKSARGGTTIFPCWTQDVCRTIGMPSVCEECY